jgi:predicted nucleic acid-binding Zn ribbon protein
VAFSPVSSLLKQVLTQIGGDKYQPFILLYQGWKDVVGELLASRSHPFRFHDSVLYVAVQNNSWLQELYLRKAEILRQCRAMIPQEIRDFIFLIRS